MAFMALVAHTGSIVRAGTPGILAPSFLAPNQAMPAIYVTWMNTVFKGLHLTSAHDILCLVHRGIG